MCPASTADSQATPDFTAGFAPWKPHGEEAPHSRGMQIPLTAAREPFTCIPTRALLDRSLSHVDLHVLLAVASYSHNVTRLAHPSQAEIAERVGVSRQTVGAALRRLAGRYLEVSARTTPGRGKVGNQYRILDNAPLSSDGAQPVETQGDTGANVKQGRQRPMTNGADDGGTRQRKSAKVEAPAKKPVESVVVIGEILPPETGPMESHADIPIRELDLVPSESLSTTESSSTPPRATAKVWAARINEAIELCGDAATRTGGGLSSWPVWTALCEPVSGAPCDWEADCVPAIVQTAASMRAAGKMIRSWTLPSFAELAIANRDRRLAGNPDVKAPTNDDDRNNRDLFGANAGSASRSAAKRSGSGASQPRCIGIDYARFVHERDEREALASTAA